MILKLSYSPLYKAVLVVSIDSRKCQCLMMLVAMVHPDLCFKYAIIGMVTIYFHSIRLGIFLSCYFSLICFFNCCCFLKINVAELRWLVNVYCDVLVPFFGQKRSHLGYQAWCGWQQHIKWFFLPWLKFSLRCDVYLMFMAPFYPAHCTEHAR